jgi:hypothetical protein
MKGRSSIDYLPYHIGYEHETRLIKMKIPIQWTYPVRVVDNSFTGFTLTWVNEVVIMPALVILKS